MNRIFKVEGMSCQHCVQTITESVAQVVGVKMVDVNLEKEKVTVEFDESTTQLEEISSQIEKAGFEVCES